MPGGQAACPASPHLAVPAEARPSRYSTSCPALQVSPKASSSTEGKKKNLREVQAAAYCTTELIPQCQAHSAGDQLGPWAAGMRNPQASSCTKDEEKEEEEEEKKEVRPWGSNLQSHPTCSTSGHCSAPNASNSCMARFLLSTPFGSPAAFSIVTADREHPSSQGAKRCNSSDPPQICVQLSISECHRGLPV